MPQDLLAGKLVVPTRQTEVARYLRDYVIRNPGAAGAGVAAGTMPYIDANVYADVTGVHRSNAVTIANGTSRSGMKGTQLDAEAQRLGTFRLPPVGGAGFGIVTTSPSGAPIVAGDLLTGPNGTVYQAVLSTTVQSGAQIGIIGVSTGPSTNVPAGTVLSWVSPRTGMQPNVTVTTQADGSGFTGGNNVESDDQLRARLDYIAANPASAGNDAHYQSVIMQAPAVAVQQAFTVPAVFGGGTIAWTFTVRPSQPGASRIPNAQQLALVAAYVQGVMPADDSSFACTIVASQVAVGLQVIWSPSAAGWADASPFPTFQGADAGGNFNWQISSGTSPLTPTTFSIKSVEPSVTPTVPPVGSSFGLFDLASLTFRRKKILSQASDMAGGFVIVVDATQGLSDTSYVPVVGQRLSPWSDSLASLIPPVLPFFDTTGVGEQYAVFPDPGLRQRRNPTNPGLWPSGVTNRLLGGATVARPPQGPQQNQPAVPTLLNLPALSDVQLVEPVLPYPCPVGTPGVSFNLLTLGDLVAYPE